VGNEAVQAGRAAFEGMVDMLLFLNYKTMWSRLRRTPRKAQGGKRVIYTSHHPCWDAKKPPQPAGRDGLGLQKHRTPLQDGCRACADAVKPIDRLRSLMAESNVTDAELQKVVGKRDTMPPTLPSTAIPRNSSPWPIKYWSQILNLINADRRSWKTKEDFYHG
jgi:hypothetical protein